MKNTKTIFLSLLFICFTSSLWSLNLAVYGMKVNNYSLSSSALEELCREESIGLTNLEILSERDMVEQLGYHPELKNVSKRKLLKLGNSLAVDYILSGSMKVKEGAMIYHFELLNVPNACYETENELTFTFNEKQVRRMVRISLRDLYDYFYQIENQITFQQ
jgi:hypothetical protein